MNPETIKQTIEATIEGVTPLAQKLGIAIDKVMEWAIRQNYVYAVQDLMALLLAVILTVATASIGKKARWDYSAPDNTYAFAYCILFALSFIAWIVGIMCLFSATSRLINPEWHAIIDIVNTVKSYKQQ